MGPDKIRNIVGFAGIAASVATLFVATPTLAQGLNPTTIMGAAPLAVAIGAGAFGLIATTIIRRIIRENRAERERSALQVSALRARLDEYEALLSGSREIVIHWTERAEGPRVLGQSAALLPAGQPAEDVLVFANWLTPADADRLAQSVEALRVNGQSFETTVRAIDGRVVRAIGGLVGTGTALRLRPAAAPPPSIAPVATPDHQEVRQVIGALNVPAFLRDAKGRLIGVNTAWHELAKRLGRRSSDAHPAELLELAQRTEGAHYELSFGEGGRFEPVEIPLETGMAGYLKPIGEGAERGMGLAHLSAIIDALATPIAIFNATRGLVQFNRAYALLFGLDAAWLKPGLDERLILDKLRTEGKLPNEPDYQAWRARHLGSYQLRMPSELPPWHLPDGRTVQIIAAPAGPKGGVIYVFEDITDQLALKSQHRALLDVQRSTLNALSEAVAVFGTNGRLTLSNPRLSLIWKVPANLLAANPHIDQVAEAVGAAMPEDGVTIWRSLKRSIIDLNPNRSDQQGRITRADGKLVDYAIVRLPDGQTMMTFLDVTESANYQRVLKEKNEALLTADRLKDAFVQNVSYELRSPLTNIIGFADLLASGAAGDLNDKQRSYTDYIRASSVTLGVLIDNILDLATVDAGIAELRPELQDVAALVDKACTGVTATFPEIDGERAIKLKVEIAPDLPAFVADGTRVVQVLYNLLSNAARYSEPGGEVRLTVAGRPGRLTFTVEDDSVAMSEDIEAALEERADLAVTGRQRGVGLGLAIVRAFVSLHGGTIKIEQREPRGTRVVVSLPSDVAMVGAAE
jgi:signal transduction histidine kinase